MQGVSVLHARDGALLLAWRPLALLPSPALYRWTSGEASPPLVWSRNGRQLLIGGLAVPLNDSDTTFERSDAHPQDGVINGVEARVPGPEIGREAAQWADDASGSANGGREAQHRPSLHLSAVLEFGNIHV